MAEITVKKYPANINVFVDGIRILYGSKSSILYDIECGKGIGYTKEEAEAKLKEAGEQE